MPECNCDMRTKLIGDGCSVCNPDYAAQFAHVRRGWRAFKCEQCGLVFALPTRDHASQSVEDCPVCRANIASCEMQPIRSLPDPELKVDAHGNLLNGGV